jgi:subtilisin family serine protease
MNYKFTLLVAFMMTGITLCAQNIDKFDLRSRVLMPLNSVNDQTAQGVKPSAMKAHSPVLKEDRRKDVLLTLTHKATISELEALGLDDVVLIGRQALGKATTECLSRLSTSDLVKIISFSPNGHLHNDLSRKASHVDAVRSGSEGLSKSYTGKGVIVGIFDKGIDFNHVNFLSNDLKDYRIRRVWKYETTGENSSTETCYDTPEKIKDLVTDDSTYTHGTHTLGILAGAFAVHNDTLDVDYSGMAPDADILVGCGPIKYSYVLRAIQHFQEYADSVGKPLVVNLSFGDNLGPHDGTDTYAAALNTLAAKTPIIVSAGNDGANKVTLTKRLSQADNTIRTVVTSKKTMHQSLDVSYEAVSELQVWSEDTSKVQVAEGLWSIDDSDWVCQVPVPQDYQASYVGNGDFKAYSSLQSDDFDYLYKNSIMGYATGTDQTSNRYMADIYLQLQRNMENIDQHIIPVIIVKGKAGKRVDIYCDGTYNELSSDGIMGWDSGSGDGTISDIACGKNIISVGSYCTRKITDESTVGEVSPFSSWGELIDGRNLPDVLAPGDCIASSMSTPFTASSTWSKTVYPAVWGMMYGDQANYWTIQQGTSQAAPAVAGIVALWLQVGPTLTPEKIKDIVKGTTAPLPVMTRQCGAGKVDALAGMQKILNIKSTSVNTISEEKSGQFTVSGSGNMLTFCFQTLKGFSVSVFNITGQCVWQGRSTSTTMPFDGNSLPASVYVVKAMASGHCASQKIMIK